MSESMIETPAAVEFDAEDFSTVGDNSRVEDVEAYRTNVAELRDAAIAAGAAQVNDSSAKARLARARAFIRGTIKRPDGFPDWGANSDVYKTVIERVESNALASVPGLDDKNRKKLTDAVRQQVSRTWLLQAVALWIVTHEAGFAREAEKASTPEGLAALVASPTAKLRKRITEHYSKARNLSNPYKEDNAGGTGSAGTIGADAVTTNLKRATKGVAEGGVVPSVSTTSILTMLLGIGRQVTGGTVGEVENRPVVIDNLQSISRLSLLIAKSLDGKASDAELSKLSEMVEVPGDEDTPEADGDEGDGDEAPDADVVAADAEAKKAEAANA